MYLFSNVLNVIVTIWEYIDMNSLSIDFLPFYIFSVDIVSLLTILAGALRLPIYLTCQPHIRKEFADYVKMKLHPRQPQVCQQRVQSRFIVAGRTAQKNVGDRLHGDPDKDRGGADQAPPFRKHRNRVGSLVRLLRKHQ
ncbi:hypothetical protein L596_027528 [Steinernema carpocapsae]|nr:hypothetical protein L596_027528 [Steinernema carpocapsae]